MDEEIKIIENENNTEEVGPAKSVVRVYFPDRNMKLSYFNDCFDLHVGDYVYVEGKLEGLRGQVIEVAHNFKIKVSDYKRVIGKADTAVKGKLHISDSYFIAFTPDVIPYEKVITWYKAPDKEYDEYVSGSDETSFSLDDLKEMHLSKDAAERGHDYYVENRVLYICLNGTHGRAIVRGTKAYEIEFKYEDGKISNLVCDCYCSNTCKHEFAAMLQLREILKLIEKSYTDLCSGYWAVTEKVAFYNAVIADRQNGTILLG